ncbi:Eco57I restriction-modification methylase domain-containing protein [Treponema sp. OMZ 788]|uniref:Eco57I restriction-modification methylase domain-containing protein n=1 Tax=Treponema sp. OMZ 788 TaxID=2563664 RepID=UPI0020A51DB2|nr:N-6 DNA methylase [Treponema sp. OMZ 788]
MYYTPQYIVRYIVDNTIGIKIRGKTPEDIAKLKVVDPACGSGSFLVEAYQALLNYHLDYYSNEKERKTALKNGYIYEAGKNVYKLTIEEKQRMLLNSIYGVDIDGQAVEVTKLSLYLKLLENEGSETQGQLFKFSDLTLLPSLDSNIKCGNSLVGSDYYNEKDLSLFDDEAMRKINTFDWDKEFPEVFAQGGFDCVIGNPPYVRIQTLNETNSDLVQFYNSKYIDIVSGSYDLYILFIYKGFSLLRKNGLLGFIQPHKFFQAETGEKIRTLLHTEQAISQIVDFTTNQIFENATTYTCLLFLEKSKKETFLYKRFELNEDFTTLDTLHFETIPYSALDNSCWLFHSGVKDILLKKIGNQSWNFKDITSKIFKGSSTGNDKIFLFDLIEEQENVFIVKSALSSENVVIEKGIMRKFLYGEDVRRYENPTSKKWLLFPYEKVNERYCLLDVKKLKACFPLAYAYLNEHKTTLLARKLPLTNNDFYKYSAARSLNDYEQPKILIPDMLVQNRIAYDTKREFFTGPAIHCPVFNQQASNVDIKLYLTILNSKLFWFFISNTSTALRGNAYRLTPEYLVKFSFPQLDNTQPLCIQLITLADQMLETQGRLHQALSDEDKKLLEQRAEIIDKEIDKAVYQLYGLTEEEIKIVEER